MATLKTYSVSIDTTGTAGSATGTGTIAVAKPGYLEWVRLDFHASAAATTDVTGTMASSGSPASTLLFTSTDSKTDITQFPRTGALLPAGTAITNSGERMAIAGNLTVSVAQCDALTAAVVVTIGVWT